MKQEKRGKCVIFSAPSGAGKTTIVHALIKQLNFLEFSISACNREPRVNEQNGSDYYFFSTETFQQKIAEDAFLEWEEVYPNNFYGTLKSEVQRIWSENKIVVFDVDVIGGLKLKEKLGEQALAIFVSPPSMEILEERLNNRSTETPEKIKMRLGKAKHEMSYAKQFDTILVNEILENSVRKAKDLIETFISK